MDSRRISPEPGQESVWDYPRPPRLEESPKQIQIIFNGVTIVETRRSQRILETSHPPVYYISPDDIQMQYLVLTGQSSSFCEWKGAAIYYSIVVGDREAKNAAWAYPQPTPSFAAIKDYLAFYPQMMDGCYVNGEKVEPQPGGFYGGWITKDIVGPFKGGPGTWGW